MTTLDKKQLDRRATLILVGCGIFIVGLMALHAIFMKNAGRVNRMTLCRTDRPLAGVTVVLIDKTDAMTADENKQLSQRVDQLKARIWTNAMLSVCVINDRAADILDQRFCMCNPGSGDSSSWIFQNPRFIQAKWDTAFGHPLEVALADAAKYETATTSPIMEAILYVSEEETFATTPSNRHLIIVSDMLQNTRGFSQYGRTVSYEDFEKTEYFSRIAPDLKGVDVEVDYLVRPQYRPFQQDRHKEFWKRFFQAAGATRVVFRNIRGSYRAAGGEVVVRPRTAPPATIGRAKPELVAGAVELSIPDSARVSPMATEGEPADTASHTATSDNTAMLQVVAEPPDAEILVDGEPAGTATVNRTIPPGIHDVTVRASGYGTIRETIVVLGGTHVRKRYQLERLSNP